MQLDQARTLATTLLARHGLPGWRVVFDNAKTRAGVCRFDRHEIGLSRVLTRLHTDDEVRDTVLHEIAHALVGAGHGHDAVWRAQARAIGCSGLRCVSETAARAPAPWRGSCPAGHQVSRYRQPVRVQTCGRCSSSFDPAALITWTLNGRAVPMHPAYVAELAALAGRYVPAAAGDRGLAVGGTASAAARTTERGRPLPTRPASAPIPVGARVRLSGRGRYAGLVGIVVKRARTRYHVRTQLGLVTAPFALVTALGD